MVYLQAHRDSFRVEQRFTFRQVCLNSVSGAFHGFLTGATLDQTPSAAFELIGTLVALWSAVRRAGGVNQSALGGVAVRVLGSWIAATGLLMIDWSLRAGN